MQRISNVNAFDEDMTSALICLKKSNINVPNIKITEDCNNRIYPNAISFDFALYRGL